MLHTKMTTALLLAVVSVTIFLSCSIGTTNAQENIQPNIPPSLVECYNTSFFENRDNRLPTTIDTLITLIEKIENSDGFNMDIRTLAVALLHRFRQDGIQRARGVIAQPGVIPYSPTGFQFPKFRILLSRLIPGNALQFPNNSLSREERCSLHFMLSSTFNMQVRGDENTVCSQLSQYRAQRVPRDADGSQWVPKNFLGDVEVLESISTSRAQKRGINRVQQSGQQIRPNDFDYVDYGYDNSGSNQVSQCPVEDGVIWTPWGAVTAGTVIAGIAAGLQPQQVQLRTLLALSSRRLGLNLPQTTTISVDNRWAATLSGDLAEVALVQVPETQQAAVGANGAWNNTVTPRWYFLTQRQNLEMTDAEIRGGLDGLILAMNIGTWRTQASSLKLSQLLRMYYSMDGVMGSGIMACNRKDQFPNVAPLNQMNAQTSAFAQVLNNEMKLRVTLDASPIATFSSAAASALETYVPQSLNDVSCSVSNSPSQDATSSVKAMTNIYVFLDTTWQYNDVNNYVTAVIKKLNIYPDASSITMLAAQDGSVIVNTTNLISDYYEKWNITTHSWHPQGFNLPTVLRTVQNLTQTLMSGEQKNNTVGGRSLVALLIPSNNAQINDADSNFAITRLQYINEQVPDLKFIYYAGGTMQRFSTFVQNPSTDIFPLGLGTPPATAASPVIARIKQIPRRIINPRCGASWYTSSWGTDQMPQYAGPGKINYYRMAPNYFFGQGSGRNVNIQAQGGIQFTVCSSRSTALPSQNSTANGGSTDVTCTKLTGNTYSYDLSNACNGYYTIHQCPPLYISVQAPQASSSGGGLTTSCIDAACQTPDQAKYTVSVTNLGCFSGVAKLIASLGLIALAALLREFL